MLRQPKVIQVQLLEPDFVTAEDAREQMERWRLASKILLRAKVRMYAARGHEGAVLLGIAVGTVDKARQSIDPPVLFLDLVGGVTVELTLVEATSSVLLRNRDGRLEYAD